MARNLFFPKGTGASLSSLSSCRDAPPLAAYGGSLGSGADRLAFLTTEVPTYLIHSTLVYLHLAHVNNIGLHRDLLTHHGEPMLWSISLAGLDSACIWVVAMGIKPGSVVNNVAAFHDLLSLWWPPM